MTAIENETLNSQDPEPESHALGPRVVYEPRLFTVNDYYLMGRAGLFQVFERTELVDGQVRRVNPISPLHAKILCRLNGMLFPQAGDKVTVSARNPLHFNEFTEFHPDVKLIVKRDEVYMHRHPQPEDVLLVIEASDSLLKTDRDDKRSRYAKANIPEVWIIDLQEQQIEQYSQPNNGMYEKKSVSKIDDEIRSQGTPQVVIPVGKLFR